MTYFAASCLLLVAALSMSTDTSNESNSDTMDCSGLRGNGHCDLECLQFWNGFDDGGDCSYTDYCAQYLGNFQCDVECYDLEKYTDDCKCPKNLLSNGRCNLACIWAPEEQGDCHCTVDMVGNGHCDEDCMSTAFYYDGGDCFKERY